jgi:hypothetical protein
MMYEWSMPKKISRDVRLLSIRVPVEVGDWIQREADSRGDSVNERAVEAFEDMRGWFGLTVPMIQVLEEDRKKSELPDFREYVRALLTRRYNELIISAASGHAKSKR